MHIFFRSSVRFASLLALVFTLSAGADDKDHAGKGDTEKPRSQTPGMVSLDGPQSDLLRDKLRDSLTLIPKDPKNPEAGYTIRISTGDGHMRARADLRAALAGTPIFEILNKYLHAPAKVFVWNAQTAEWETKEVNGLGVLLGAAISQLDRDKEGTDHRAFLFNDGTGKIASAVAFVEGTEEEDFDRVETIITALADAEQKMRKEQGGNVWRLPRKIEDKQPPNRFLEYSVQTKGYEFKDNSELFNKYLGREGANKVVSDAGFRSEVAQVKKEEFTSADAYAEAVLSRPKVSEMIDKSTAAGKEEHTKVQLKQALKDMWNYNPDPNHPNSFEVQIGGSAQAGVVSPKDPNRKRIALIQTDGNYGARTNSARSQGAEIETISNLDQAAAAVLKASEEAGGEPVEVLLCSHGCPGYMNAAKANTPALKRFIQSVKGKVSCIYGLGCSVGGNATATNRPHLLRDLAVGLGVPAIGAPQTLMSGGANWVSGGNVVIVKPKKGAGDENDPSTFLSNGAVWEK